MGTRRKSLLTWIFIFSTLFVLSLDFWWWAAEVPLGWGNLPAWIYYFVLLQLALSLAIWGFARRHWADESSEANNDR